jgi:GNAT superfamily N-acetyltransferase
MTAPAPYDVRHTTAAAIAPYVLAAAEDLRAQTSLATRPYLWQYEADSECIAVFDDIVVIALLVYCLYDGWLFIGLAWTHPAHRREGLYRRLVNEAVDLARARGLPGVYAAVGVSNDASIAAHSAIFPVHEEPIAVFRKPTR